MGKLDGRVAIITGAAQGMGEAHVRRFVTEGAKVALTDLNEERGQQIAEELGDAVFFVKHDVTSLQDWKRVVDQDGDRSAEALLDLGDYALPVL